MVARRCVIRTFLAATPGRPCEPSVATPLKKAELVALRVGEHHPRDVTLADIDAPGAQRDEPLSFVANAHLFGDLAEHRAFTEAYLGALDAFHRLGARATLEQINAG